MFWAYRLSASGKFDGLKIEDEHRRFVARTNRLRVDRDLLDHLKDAGVTLQFIARDGFRVQINTVVKLSFPRSNKVGKTSINRDLGKIFIGMDKRDILKQYDERYGDGSSVRSKKKRAAANAKSRKIQEAKFNWRGDQGEMRAWHHQHRGNKGRVKRTGSRIVFTAGERKIRDVMYVPMSALKKYKRSAYSSIAEYKAGWQPALEYLGRVTGGRLVLPAFVRKQPKKLGKVVDGLKADGSGSISAFNLVPYARRLTEPWMRIAATRTEAYLDKATKKQSEAIAKRFNEL